ncbi:ABC-2 type transport system ATP-binding protein [Ureibacillus xyleni]|uniref:ABC-2 type transport system ATP-binding protein n=1 Tax=Ureibacillus xyleni TaxID=614648 RepID=A0A285TKP2_9BACL|nr:ABC transporter ATP-binding protein [Ureibacillus xyleni]SOC23158.1 ABC-2 type transport system ATP-binding protein [Ureibacillus xyleni]
MTLISVSDLTKTFGNQTVVDHISFSIESNTSTALIGPNGAGKTTTLSMLTGLLSQTSGSIKMDGVKDMRSVIGFLPQYPKFFSWLSALEYTEMAAKLSGVEAKQARLQSQKILEYVGLGSALHKKTETFSGGMKQRLGIAQALVHKPKLLLLDEPVSALDPVGRREIMNLLKEIQNETTILYSTHILNDAEEMTDQLLFLRGGKLVEKGSLNEVRARFEEPRIKIKFSSQEQALQFASQAELHCNVEGETVFVEIDHDQPTMQQLLNRLANSNFSIESIEKVTANLEEIFMKVVGSHESV